MSQAGNIHTINLGKVLLSQRQHRAVRAINMIREYTVHHMGATNVKIDEKLAHQIWARGVRRPPRKVTVEFIQDGDVVLVAPYEEEPDIPEAPPAKTDAGALAEPRDDDDVEKAASPPEEEQPAANQEDSAKAASPPEEEQPAANQEDSAKAAASPPEEEQPSSDEAPKK